MSSRCGTTHCRNIILQHQPVTIPGLPATPPGPVTDLLVTTPHVSNSGVATATFYSPDNAEPGTLDYIVSLTGGVGQVEIISIVPVS